MIKEYTDKILSFGFDTVCDIPTESLIFDNELRKFCKQNLCGNYCRNYACPPICGTPDEMRRNVMKYKNTAVFHKRIQIAENCDLDKMQEDVRKCMYEAVDFLKGNGIEGIASAPGPCRLCKECGAVKGTECRHPDKIMSCISAYCINAKEMAETCGIEYDGGGKAVNFFCLYFYNRRDTK